MMEMLNKLLELAVTGLFSALFITLFIKLGWLPLMAMIAITEEDLADMEDED